MIKFQGNCGSEVPKGILGRRNGPVSMASHCPTSDS